MIRRALRRRPGPWFAAAAVLATLAAFSTVRVATGRGELAGVIVASHALPAGATPEQADGSVHLVQIAAAAVLPGMLQTFDDIGGRPLAVPVAGGEPITDASLGGAHGIAPEPLRPGERAISVPLAAAGAAAPVLVPGARIDVVASTGDTHAEALVIVADAQIIAQVAPPGEEGPTSEGGALLVRVSERAALRLSAALDGPRGVRILPRPFVPGSAGAVP